VQSGALVDVAVSSLQLTQFARDQILETRLRDSNEVEKLKSGKVEK
jgi:hypothetical protein